MDLGKISVVKQICDNRSTVTVCIVNENAMIEKGRLLLTPLPAWSEMISPGSIIHDLNPPTVITAQRI
jgi:hypothetical protein